MKKFLVVLLVLFVAGGVFAQEGEWWLGAQANIGTAVDFDQDPAQIMGTGYNELYEGWGPIDGQVQIGYNKGGFSGNLTLNARDANTLFSEASYNGGHYGFTYNANLLGGWGIRRLWGFYNFLNDLVYLEAAYDARDNGDGFWSSEKTAATFFGKPDYPRSAPMQWDGAWSFRDSGLFGGGDTFTHTDHGTALISDVRLSGLSFGIMFRNLFGDGPISWVNGWDGSGAAPTITSEPFIDNVLKKLVVGAKFNMAPIEFAAQMQMENYGVYFGGKADLGPLTVGLSFMGLFPENTGTLMSFGVSVNYNAELFGAGIRGWYGMDDIGMDVSQIAIEPTFWYNVIPTHLQFKLDVGFYFNYGDKALAANGDADKAYVQWGFQPQLFWNFMGTGAPSGYWGVGTGVLVRYRMLRDLTNSLDVTFKWNM